MVRNKAMRYATASWLIVAAVIGSSVADASDSVGRNDRDYGHLALRKITFPVQGGGERDFDDDFGDPRSEGWLHKGQDIFAKKMTKILAATDGTISWVRVDDGTHTSGNALALTAPDGWTTWYMHINNDTPGTDDGSNLAENRFAPGIALDSVVKAGDFIAYLGDSGDAETTDPHLHFEIRNPDKVAVNPHPSLRLALGVKVGSRCAYDPSPARTPSSSSAGGYYQLGSDGGVFSFGTAVFRGSTGDRKLNAPVNGMSVTKSGKGYWLVASDGGVFSFGDAPFLGSAGALKLNAPMIGMIPTSTSKGYWLVASDGGVFSYGDATFAGSAGATALTSPVVGLAPTPTNKGYWLVQSDGTVLSYGDAADFGSLKSMAPAAGKKVEPIVSIAATPSGKGYLQLGNQGTVYAFGDGEYFGSLAPELSGLCWARTATSLRASATGHGYWITTTDGAIWAYGDAKSYGDMRGDLTINRLNGTMIGQAVLPAA